MLDDASPGTGIDGPSAPTDKPLVDSHCHLDFPDFADELDDVVHRAGSAGIGHMLTICTHVTKFDQVLAVAERYDNISCSVGIHPHEAENEPAVSPERLMELAEHPKVVAFGETGLDFFYEHSPREAQARNFRAHLQASQRAQLPIIVHARDADDETASMMAEAHGQGAFPGVIHCFTGGMALAEQALELGLYISFSGILTFKKAEELRDVARMVPLDRILVETDSPYLAPEPKRGRRNEPAFTAFTAQRLAEIKGVSEAEIAAVTTRNFHRLFAKASAATGTGGGAE